MNQIACELRMLSAYARDRAISANIAFLRGDTLTDSGRPRPRTPQEDAALAEVANSAFMEAATLATAAQLISKASGELLQ